MAEQNVFRGVFGDELSRDALLALLTPISKMADIMPTEITSDKITVKVVEPSHVSMIVIDIPDEAFWEYEYTGPELLRVGLPVKDMIPIIKRAGKNDRITIETGIVPPSKEGDYTTYIMRLTVEGGRTKKTYSFKDLIDPVNDSSYPTKIPKITFSRFVELPTKELFNYLTEISDYTDKMRISVGIALQEERVPVILKSINAFEKDIEIETYGKELHKGDPEKKIKSAYPIDWLLATKTLSKIFDEVELRLDEQYPINMVFSNEKITVQHITAPVIEE